MKDQNIVAVTPFGSAQVEWTAEAMKKTFDQFHEAQRKAREEEKIGDAYYLLSSAWYKKWERDVKDGVEGKQAPIDNADLRDPTDLSLREGLAETYDFILVSEPAWTMLRKCFDGGPEFRREVIFNGFEQVIEVYRLNLTLMFTENEVEKEIEMRDISKQLTVDDLRDKFLERYPQYSADDYQIFFAGAKDPINGTLSLQQADVNQGTRLEIVPRGGREDRQYENGVEEAELTLEDYRKNKHAGLTGLLNLGYTCFMNSTLQCLSNTEMLTEYFLSGRYLDEINEDNPIGRQGNLAKAYATVIRHLWKAEERSYAPRALKLQIGRYAPQFHGYTQQDSQELMAFLMDGLHEVS